MKRESLIFTFLALLIIGCGSHSNEEQSALLYPETGTYNYDAYIRTEMASMQDTPVQEIAWTQRVAVNDSLAFTVSSTDLEILHEHPNADLMLNELSVLEIPIAVGFAPDQNLFEIRDKASYDQSYLHWKINRDIVVSEQNDLELDIDTTLYKLQIADANVSEAYYGQFYKSFFEGLHLYFTDKDSLFETDFPLQRNWTSLNPVISGKTFWKEEKDAIYLITNYTMDTDQLIKDWNNLSKGGIDSLSNIDQVDYQLVDTTIISKSIGFISYRSKTIAYNSTVFNLNQRLIYTLKE